MPVIEAVNQTPSTEIQETEQPVLPNKEASPRRLRVKRAVAAAVLLSTLVACSSHDDDATPTPATVTVTKTITMLETNSNHVSQQNNNRLGVSNSVEGDNTETVQSPSVNVFGDYLNASDKLLVLKHGEQIAAECIMYDKDSPISSTRGLWYAIQRVHNNGPATTGYVATTSFYNQRNIGGIEQNNAYDPDVQQCPESPDPLPSLDSFRN